MPVALVIFGLVLELVAYRGTERELAGQVATDFGKGTFWAGAGAVAIIAAAGAFKPLRTVSDGLLVLVFFMWLVGNRQALPQLSRDLTSLPSPAPAVPLPPPPKILGGGGNSGSGSGAGGASLTGGSGGSSGGGLLNTAMDLYGAYGGGGSSLGTVATAAALA